MGWWYTTTMQNAQTNNAKMQQYFDKIKTYILSLRDVRNVGMLAFVVLVLLVSYSGARAVQTNYSLQKQVYELAKSNDVSRLTNANLELTNKYYGTSQYLEVTARQNLGLAAPGETELLVPKSVAMAHTVEMPADENATKVEKVLPFWQRNFREWVNFFLHRSTD